MLEQSATLAAAEQQEEPLQRRLSGLPPPVADYLQSALGGPQAGSQHKCVHRPDCFPVWPLVAIKHRLSLHGYQAPPRLSHLMSSHALCRAMPCHGAR